MLIELLGMYSLLTMKVPILFQVFALQGILFAVVLGELKK